MGFSSSLHVLSSASTCHIGTSTTVFPSSSSGSTVYKGDADCSSCICLTTRRNVIILSWDCFYIMNICSILFSLVRLIHRVWNVRREVRWSSKEDELLVFFFCIFGNVCGLKNLQHVQGCKVAIKIWFFFSHSKQNGAISLKMVKLKWTRVSADSLNMEVVPWYGMMTKAI